MLLRGPDGAAPADSLDADGDGVSDALEGFGSFDTDGDGTPDSLDEDSDGDRIPDRIEGHPVGLGGELPDADGDGLPDLRDLDSDGDGRLDLFDGARDGDGRYPDFDGDGREDFRDLDDDQDFIGDVEELGRFPATAPRDTDGDGAPDFRDTDSDDDTIQDLHEGSPEEPDADYDGLPNPRDLDADGDGLSDAREAGDEDLATPPADTDGDRVPDFLDRDSDNDGLSDELEGRMGSDPLRGDTDDDGVSDLIELGGGTDPADPTDNPRVRGDFVFVVPFEGSPDPSEDLLRFRTSVRRADLYFLFDTTESMAEELEAFRRDIAPGLLSSACARSGASCRADAECAEEEICGLDGLCVEDPGLAGCIASLHTGLGRYGGGGSSYRNLVSIQPDVRTTAARIPGAFVSDGGKALFESAACVADPNACFAAGCVDTGIGCPGFRPDAVPVLVLVTDGPNRCERFGDPGCLLVNDPATAGASLQHAGVGFIGVDAADRPTGASVDLTRLALAAGSVSELGRPFVYAGRDADVVPSLLGAVRELAAELRLFVELKATDQPGDAGDALQFIERLEAVPGEGCAEGSADTDGDGLDDSFPSLTVGTPACWRIVVRPNLSEPAGPEPRLFEAELVVAGANGALGSPLDRRRVIFLVPADTRFCGPDDPRPDCR